jgi:hypothetical protein
LNAIRIPLRFLRFVHVLVGKALPTFPGHAVGKSHGTDAAAVGRPPPNALCLPIAWVDFSNHSNSRLPAARPVSMDNDDKLCP